MVVSDGKDFVGEHYHPRNAKYIHPAGPKRKVQRWHDHDSYFEGEPYKRRIHEAKDHDGDLITGRHPHEHSEPVEGASSRCV